jgi:hypothetical protein
MRLRYAGQCRLCGQELAAKTRAVYEPASKTVLCLECAGAGGAETEGAETASLAPRAPDPVPSAQDPAPKAKDEPAPALPADVYVIGDPGRSARQEFERRHKKREDRVRTAHPKIGGFLLAISDDPQSTAAWSTGATGEEVLGKRMNQAAGPLFRVLHDRRIPRSTANIDHIVVAGSGVWVVDAKRYKGRPALRVEGGILSPRVEKLTVGGRDCTKLVDGVLKQVGIVQGILDQHGEGAPVFGALCFVDADWPLFGGAIKTKGVRALWWDKLSAVIRAAGPLGEADVYRVWSLLAGGLPDR